MIQSWLFYEVCSSPVKVNQQLPEGQTDEGQALSGHIDDTELGKPFRASSDTLPPQGNGVVDTFLFHLKRHSRRARPCERGRQRKWNDCLQRFIDEIHCRRLSVGCLSANNVPPKCKKNYQAILGEKGYCRILTSCTCAAWRHFSSMSMRDVISSCSWQLENFFQLCFSF